MISSRRCLEAPHQLGSSPALILNLPPASPVPRVLGPFQLAHTSSFQARNQNSPQPPVLLFTSPRQGPFPQACQSHYPKQGPSPEDGPTPPAEAPPLALLPFCALAAPALPAGSAFPAPDAVSLLLLETELPLPLSAKDPSDL